MGRIKALVIPPAWTDVRICPDASGHVQAVGTDAAGRRQYPYTPRDVPAARNEEEHGTFGLASIHGEQATSAATS
jgi:DNA topoisomerase IB